jgi:hypothetical protein
MQLLSSVTYSIQIPTISSFIKQKKIYIIGTSILLGICWIANKILHSIRAKKEPSMLKSIPEEKMQILKSFKLRPYTIQILQYLYQNQENLALNIIEALNIAINGKTKNGKIEIKQAWGEKIDVYTYLKNFYKMGWVEKFPYMKTGMLKCLENDIVRVVILKNEIISLKKQKSKVF